MEELSMIKNLFRKVVTGLFTTGLAVALFPALTAYAAGTDKGAYTLDLSESYYVCTYTEEENAFYWFTKQTMYGKSCGYEDNGIDDATFYYDLDSDGTADFIVRFKDHVEYLIKAGTCSVKQMTFTIPATCNHPEDPYNDFCSKEDFDKEDKAYYSTVTVIFSKDSTDNNTTQPADDNNTTQPADDNNTTAPADDNNTTQPTDNNNNTPAQPADNNTPAQPADNNTPAQPADNNNNNNNNNNNTPSVNNDKTSAPALYEDLCDALNYAISKGEKGTVEYKTTGDALPLYVIKKLVNNPNITLDYTFVYEGNTYNLKLNKKNIKFDESIEWYGPLYLLKYAGKNK